MFLRNVSHFCSFGYILKEQNDVTMLEQFCLDISLEVLARSPCHVTCAVTFVDERGRK